MARYGKFHLIMTAFVTASFTYLFLQTGCNEKSLEEAGKARMVLKEPHIIYDQNNNEYEYSRSMPLIFIGGMPRSGTTLMRAMLDSHPDIRCGEETRVIPRLLGMRAQWEKSPREHARLEEAGLTGKVIDDAIGAFMLEVIAKHGAAAPRLCNKDPFVLRSTKYLNGIFPNGKFLLMIRDGRATVHSIISRKVTISGFDIKSYRDCLKKWNMAVESMYNQCLDVGSSRCMPVFYEQLVLHPEKWLQDILKFLDVRWNDNVMHHDKHIGNEISLSKRERSTDQVVKPVNMEGLTKWVGQIPPDVIRDMPDLAPMLVRLGYDPRANPPNYGNPDTFVLNNEAYIRSHREELDKRIQKVFGDENADLENNPAANEEHPIKNQRGGDDARGAPEKLPKDSLNPKFKRPFPRRRPPPQKETR